MRQKHGFAMIAALALWAASAWAEVSTRIVDIPTRPEVTVRVMALSPSAPKAAVILFAGGHGGLQLSPDGEFGWGKGNFLVRTRQRFADQGLLTVVVDAPSDRQSIPFMTGFRQTPAHVSDIQAVIAWVRQQAAVPVWLVGTSRGTQSVAYLATELKAPAAPDGIVLSASMLSDNKMLPVPALPLEKIAVPVLVVHHELDGCGHCQYRDIPALMDRLKHLPRTALLAFKDGQSRGDPCEAMAYHGFNGIEAQVVAAIAQWVAE